MDVKFVTSKRSLIDTIPIADGQIIASEDTPGMYYDMNEQRRCIGPITWLPLTDSTSSQIVEDSSISILQLYPNGGSDCQLQQASPINTLVGVTGSPVPLINMPEPVRNGYKFIGWFKNQNDPSTKETKFPETFPEGLTIYYASWLQL